jgi:hypothetical protein
MPACTHRQAGGTAGENDDGSHLADGSQLGRWVRVSVTGCVVGKASQTARQARRGGSLESERGSDQTLVERIAGLAGCLAGGVDDQLGQGTIGGVGHKVSMPVKAHG